MVNLINVRNSILHVVLASLIVVQAYLALQGVLYFNKYTNSLLLFSTSSITACLCFYMCSLKGQVANKHKSRHNLLAVLLVGIAIVFSSYYFYLGLNKYPNPAEASDIIPQLQALYHRFMNGDQPYFPVEEISHRPYPVYMPAHWISVGLSDVFNCDLRWVGFGLLCLAITLFSFLLKKKSISVMHYATSILLFFFVINAYSFWGGHELFISFETPVAAFYIVLALGLAQRNLIWIGIGLVLCLLSRYTLVFWLPLFGLILLNERSLKVNIIFWSAIAFSIVIFYVIPFLLREPGILAEGIAYHNLAAIREWHGYGTPPVSWSHETGIYFAPYLKNFFSGSSEDQVYKTRILQAALMLLLNITGFIVYRKAKKKLHYFDLSLIMLFVFLIFFYSFGALTYRYYLLTPFLLAVAIFSITIMKDPYSAKQV